MFLLPVLPVLAATLLSRWTGSPWLIPAAGVGGFAVFQAVRVARAQGAPMVWITLGTLAILAGELSAVSLGGQNGRLLWADAVFGAGVMWALAQQRFVFPFPSAPFITRMVPLVAWSALSLLFARDVLTGIAELKEWVVALAVGIAAVTFAADARRARQLLMIVACTGGLIAVMMAHVAVTAPSGLILAVLFKKVDLSWGRTNYLAGLLILSLPIALGLMMEAVRWRPRAWWLGVLLLNAVGIVLSASKGAIVAITLAILVAFARGGRSSRTGLAVMVGMIAVAAGFFTFGPLHEVMRYRLQESALEYSAGERMDLYQLAWSEFLRHPLTGIGLNNFSVASNRLRGVDTVPHNLELGLLAELGLPGALLAAGWVFALGLGAWKAKARAPTPQAAALATGLWAAFLGFTIHNQVESTIYGEQFKILLVLVAAATWRLAEPPNVADCTESTPV